MVWIYGGIFLFGSGNYEDYAPDYLLQRNVIVVTFNYRVGIFGFLSTNNEASPGNVGLKDQILALKWVQNNIKAFGGDPNNVTIFGESVGAVSISYLLTSPLTKGLFGRAIMQSGTSLCLWSLSTRAPDAARLVGKSFGIVTKNSSELVRRLKQIPAKDLQSAASVAMDVLLAPNPINGFIYSPVIEPLSESAVVTEYSYEALSKETPNRIPVIMGFNSDEAREFSPLVALLRKYIISYDILPGRLVPASMNINAKRIITLDIVGRRIREFYAGKHGNMNSDNNNNFVMYLSGNEYIRPIRKTAELMAKHSTVYLYKFSYTTSPNSTGAPHTQELPYIFVSNHTTPSDIATRNCMVELWTNFAKFGNPTPSISVCRGNPLWLPINVNESDTNYLSINRNTKLAVNPNQEEYNFWESLFTKYGNPPYSTY